MKHLDLFSGIGGFALAARWVGWDTIGFCEIDPYCRKVLRKHWSDVPIYEDVRNVTAERLRADGIIRESSTETTSVNGDSNCFNDSSIRGVCEGKGTNTSRNSLIITAGFPCQDISVAGKGAGIDGERSGLWSEAARIISEVRPRYAVLENVSALLGRGLDRVAGDLAEIGYDCEWHCISASAVGAPHRRDRIWIIAYPARQSKRKQTDQTNAKSDGWQARYESGNGSEYVADASILGMEGDRATRFEKPRLPFSPEILRRYRSGSGAAQWGIESDVGRVVARISDGLDGGRLNGQTSEGGTGEILQALRNPNDAETIQWPTGGYGGIQSEKVLLAQLCEYQGRPTPLGNVSLESKKISQASVRGVWFNGETTCPSCRRKSEKQRFSKHPDLVRLLPQLLSCDCGSTWLDPAGTPSTTSRVDRLRGLGNAIVPQVAEVIFRAIDEASK